MALTHSSLNLNECGCWFSFPSDLLCPPAHVYANKQWGPAIPFYMLKTSGSSTGLNPYATYTS